jgi:chaperonin cofactor prefoldin
LDRLEEGESVMKLIGPTLLKQDTEEVKINVNKRIEYIEAEM